MKRCLCWFNVFSVFLAAACLNSIGKQARNEKNPFAEFVRKTEPLTPEQEQKTFHLPPEFAIDLVASEPAIGKPMNIAFDARGRLWLTQSREYPFAAPTNRPARDKIIVLSDFAADGRARKVTTFAEGLNVPIGLYPYRDGCLAFSIPNIYFYEDTNGDGKADKRTKVLGEFGFNKDLHGLTSSFRRGFDGWIYAEHGFKNDSTLRASDGSRIELHSGNTYRFRPDGSRVEHNSFGQVNPFGLMFDSLGDLWGSDCHSSPVYLLLRGAYYPSFGKPDDGLGFAPAICDHSHGSTAIAGMVVYDATNFPSSFRGNTFIGNVMTCRINRDSYAEHGSTRLAKEEPDFLVCDDPWFRPVALELGLDGAIYVADFYNRIIGHYEVPLDHPGRDRERGRIWRIRYVGNRRDEAVGPLALPVNTEGLLAELGNANITRRMLATSELTDRLGTKAVAPLKKLLDERKALALQKVHALWALQRLGALDERDLARAWNESNREVRVHVMRIVGEMEHPSARQIDMAAQGTKDTDAYVRRAAAEALGRHPEFACVKPLLALRETEGGGDDSELTHVTRIALRNTLAFSNTLSRAVAGGLREADSRAIADVAIGIPAAEAATFLLAHVQKYTEARGRLEAYLRHIARYAPQADLRKLADFCRKQFGEDLDFQASMFQAIEHGLGERGAALDESVRAWGANLAAELMAGSDANAFAWRNEPVKAADTPNPWHLQVMQSTDGDKQSAFLSSFAEGGESATGVLRSKPFTIPQRLAFYIAGYDGSPDRPLLKKNYFRLRAAADETILAEARPPAKDIAQPMTWDLSKYAGRSGFLEIVDANGGHTAAWLAVGRLQPLLVPLPGAIPNEVESRPEKAAELAQKLALHKMEPDLAGLLKNERARVAAREAAAKALALLKSGEGRAEMLRIFSNRRAPQPLRELCGISFAQHANADDTTRLLGVIASEPLGLQTKIAAELAANRQSAEPLLETVETGKLSAHLLQEETVKERLLASGLHDAEARVEKLTANLEPLSEARQKLIDSRRLAFMTAKTSKSRGGQIFSVTCAVCHSINSKGGNVGPQLDGIGNRGADRLIEDILDPNRNVDPAFYYSIVTLNDDSSITGLFRREEGQLLIFANGSGAEVSVPKADIAEQRISKKSLMPDNFGEMIPEKDFNDLLSFLLSNNVNKPAAMLQSAR